MRKAKELVNNQAWMEKQLLEIFHELTPDRKAAAVLVVEAILQAQKKAVVVR